jgi:type II secretory pathway pseudopilin PulG
MFCTECGAAVSDGARFCPSCGAATPGTVPQRARPAAVTLLAVLKVVTSLFWLLLAGICTLVWETAPEGGPLAGAFTVIALTLAALAGWCAYGLWTLKPSGRILQIALSCLGLVLGFPIGTIVSVLILIYMFQPGVRLLFSARAVESFSPSEAEQTLAASKSGLATAIVVAVAVSFLAIPMLGIIAAIAIPNFLNAVDRGKQKRTIADLRSIGTAVEAYAVDRHVYPAAETIADLGEVLVPQYLERLPVLDGWQRPFQVQSNAENYLIYSFGKDGVGESCEEAVTTTFNDEICFANGQFVRYPSGTSP